MLLDLVWAVARGGRVDVSEVCGRHSSHCPSTHYVRLLGGFAPPGTAAEQRFVYPGQVLTLEYQPRRSFYAGGPPPGGGNPPGDSSSEEEDASDDDGVPRPGGDIPTSQAASSNSAANNTERHDEGRNGVDMWSPGSQHDVHLVDRPGLTSILLCGILILERLGSMFLEWVHVPVWVCASFRTRRLRLATADRRLRTSMIVLLVFCQCGLCTGAADSPRSTYHGRSGASGVCASLHSHVSSGPFGPYRAVATPCRSRHSVPLPSLSSNAQLVHGSQAHLRRCGTYPPNPISPRSEHLPVHDCPLRSPNEIDLACLAAGPTLLDSVLVREKRQAWFNAVALLETLEEHFAVAVLASPSVVPVAKVPLPIPLAEAVPLSEFQSQALSLRDVLPGTTGSQRPEELLDWLDNDLRGLLSDPAVPHCKRTLFQSIRRWHSAATGLEPDSIAVYTDGSSTSGPRPAGLPGAWAISVWVVVGASEYLLGYAADTHVPHSDSRFVGAYDDTPLTCEQLALAWALAWVIQFGAALSLPTCLVYDCQAAGLGAFGLARAPGPGHAGGSSDLSLFVCPLRQLAHTRVLLAHRHVKAHAGCVANELCDELAKRARRNPAGRSGDILPVWMGLLYAHPLKAWAWLPESGSSDLPSLFSFESEADRLQASDPVGEQGPVLGRRAARPGKAPSEFCFCLITVNVLTLLDPSKGGASHHTTNQPGLRIVAKRELLKSQFLEARALLVGLQETRLQETATLPDGHFVMLHAAADDRGHYGVALWANTTVPYACKGETKWYLTRSHFTVVECQPRLLVVSVRAPHLSWTVVVAHAPSEPPAVKGSAAAFWRACKKVLGRCARDSDVVLLADANARVGSLVSDSVSSHGAEEESNTAPDFHQFLAEFSLQLPSTFDECHSGICHTWVSPTGQCHRIDYVAVPLQWPLSGLSTVVWDTFESLQLRDDHFPLVLRAKMCCRTHDEGNVCFTCAAVRPTQVDDPSQYIAGVQQVLSAPPASWGVGVDAHYAHLVQEWTRWGRTLCQIEERHPRQSYLSAGTMQLVAWRKAWRSQLHVWKQWHRCRTLAFCLLLWRSLVQGDILGPAGVTGLCMWVDHFLLGIAQAALLIYRVGRHIKSSAKGDRVAYLAKLAHEVSLSDLKDPKLLYQRVRRAFPASRTSKRSHFCPLPAVYNADGDLASSAQEHQECWRAHFAEQEAGDLMKDEAYPDELRRQRSAVARSGPIFDIRCVPTLVDVEQTILGLPSGKATGNDGISAELLRVHAPVSARLLASIYVKSALTIYEPIEFRGGSLIPLAKRASAAFSMDKFRSILVSSLPGKILHRQYRTALIPPLQQVRGDLQAGALPGVSTEAIIMAARTFRDIMMHRQSAWSMTFFDVRAAYYRVLRQILVRTGDQEWALRKLLHELGVPLEALAELAAKMEGIGILADAGVPDHLCHLLADAPSHSVPIWLPLLQPFIGQESVPKCLPLRLSPLGRPLLRLRSSRVLLGLMTLSIWLPKSVTVPSPHVSSALLKFSLVRPIP